MTVNERTQSTVATMVAERRIANALKTGETELDLSGYMLTTLPEELSRLTQLTHLRLFGNQLSVLPEMLGDLTQLTYLTVYGNQLTSLPSAIGNLTKLTYLDVSQNKLTSLPETLGNLTQLTHLVLYENQLLALPDAIGNLTKLTYLDASQNKLISLPDAIGNLAYLIHLFTSGNQLIMLPESLGQLTRLNRLDVSDNRLRSLPAELNHLHSLDSLFLHRNSDLTIPEELLGASLPDVLHRNMKARDPGQILDYYFRTRDARRPLNEAKLALVGFGGVGKTSLVKRLTEDRFDLKSAATDGIAITDWSIPIANASVNVHVWDFGGQEIMHATHQFFLTHRSVYLIVLNGREGQEDANAEYWLNLIASFGGDSPVIIVLNKIKEHRFDLNRPALRQKFPMIRDIIATDCADPPEGRQALLEAVHREIDALAGLRDAFPAAWFDVKDQLSSMKENYLTFDRYRALCTGFGVADYDDQNQLAEVLHRLGVALNYRDDTRLHDLNVLNPRWVTEGVYKILNDPIIVAQKGELHIRDVAKILDPNSYPNERHSFLVELMRKFELCFRFPDEDEHYLIPQLLSKGQPVEVDGFDSQSCLCFEYHYPTLLPEGLVPRFIVRTYVLSSDEPRWRSGVILRFESNRALVIGNPIERKVRVRVAGPSAGRRRLLAVIRNEFDRIHASYKFKPEAMIPVPGNSDAVARYDDMTVFEAKGIREVPYVANGKVHMLSVRAMLDGVDIKGARDAQNATETPSGRFSVFISYAHRDEKLREELEMHLRLLQRIGLLHLWSDRRITAGSEWKGQIDEGIERADLVLLLISAHFINSDYCYDLELNRAMERHRAREARVIPIILRKVAWRSAPFGKLQALPADGKVVDRGGGPASRDAAWTTVAEGLETALKEIASTRR